MNGERALNRKITVTAALPYANGEIHLGHVASTYLPSDIFVRYCRLRGYDVIFVCATDDFGTPILIRAEQEGKNPREYVAYWNKKDLEDFSSLGISFDIFHKTSSKENVEFVRYFFRELYLRALIYSQWVQQSYCELDGKFLPDRYVKGTCPYCRAGDQYSDGCEKCGRSFEPGMIIEPKCSLCGRKPVTKESLHYFFKLSSFSEFLKRWLTSNENLQPEVKNYVLNWIKEGLRDWDITRDIPWGVPIPLGEAKGKVLYGWFDNHLCYISSAQTLLKAKGRRGKQFWNSSEIYHFIGKDIAYHHYLFLPAMRKGIEEEYALPSRIPTRGHLLLHSQKFSKSRGYYVGLREFLEKFPPDYLRFYLALITPYSQSDVNFDWDEFHSRINNELVANVGNFIYRSLSFIYTRYGGKVPSPQGYQEVDERLMESIRSIPQRVGKDMERNELDHGLRKVLEFSDQCNQYFQKKEPWAKKDGASTCLYLSVNAVRTLAILFEPYLPFSSADLWSQLNLRGLAGEAKWSTASKLHIKPGHVIDKPKILFRKLEKAEIERQKEKLPALH